MLRFTDITKRLTKQFDADDKSLRANYAKQNKLLAAVLEYRDLENEAKVREDRMRRVIELLGDENFEDTRKDLLAGKDVSKVISVNTDDSSPLWEAMRTILEQVSELQVVDLQDALLHFGRKSSRQAIESALASHKETFETRTRNRDKFVSLKR
jgi:uncharacterized membrane protein YgaE (UPF0421/DUF939 family)